jgi:hypothetical protein
MERAARTGAAMGHTAQMRSAAALEAQGWYSGRTHCLGLDPDPGWRACRQGGRGSQVTANCAAGLHARLARDCRFVPLLARPGGGGHARP